MAPPVTSPPHPHRFMSICTLSHIPSSLLLHPPSSSSSAMSPPLRLPHPPFHHPSLPFSCLSTRTFPHLCPPLIALSSERRLYCSRTIHAVSTSARQPLAKNCSVATPAPSITWGVIPQKSEARKIVIEYLESEGIDTTELKGIELPTSIEIMQERLDFLKKLGLSLQTINSYPLMVTCSIKKNLVPVLDYLEKLGFRSRDLPSFLEKYPMVLHSSVVIDLMPIVDFLLGLDIQKKDIHRVLLRYPDVLGFRLEGTMSTSVAYLVSIGVKARCIGRMLTEYPEILGMRVANTIKPKVDFIISYGVPKSIVARILEARPYLLGFDFDDTMKPAVDCLLEAGVRKEGIAAIITQYPDILGQNIKERLARKTKWLIRDVNVVPENVPNIIEKLPQVLFIKEELAMERVHYFMSHGCSPEDVAEMVTQCPQLLALSISQAIEPSLKFLQRNMKRSIKEIVNFPTYFTYDLKSRIMPRYNLILQRGIDCSLEWFLNCSEQKFKERIEADYIDDKDSQPVFQMGGRIYVGKDEQMKEWDGEEKQQWRLTGSETLDGLPEWNEDMSVLASGSIEDEFMTDSDLDDDEERWIVDVDDQKKIAMSKEII